MADVYGAVVCDGGEGAEDSDGAEVLDVDGGLGLEHGGESPCLTFKRNASPGRGEVGENGPGVAYAGWASDVVFPLVFQCGPFLDCLVYDLGFDLCVLGCPVGLLEGFVGVEVSVGFLDAGPFVSLS